MWTPGTPWANPEWPITSPLRTQPPRCTTIEDRNETDTLSPGTGSIVTDRIPATDPAKVTLPEAGATTWDPGPAAKSTPQCPA